MNESENVKALRRYFSQGPGMALRPERFGWQEVQERLRLGREIVWQLDIFAAPYCDVKKQYPGLAPVFVARDALLALDKKEANPVKEHISQAGSLDAAACEGLVKAWMEHTKLGPDDAVLVHQETPTGWKWWVECKEPEGGVWPTSIGPDQYQQNVDRLIAAAGELLDAEDRGSPEVVDHDETGHPLSRAGVARRNLRSALAFCLSPSPPKTMAELLEEEHAAWKKYTKENDRLYGGATNWSAAWAAHAAVEAAKEPREGEGTR